MLIQMNLLDREILSTLEQSVLDPAIGRHSVRQGDSKT
jgi:hypothetical protein